MLAPSAAVRRIGVASAAAALLVPLATPAEAAAKAQRCVRPTMTHSPFGTLTDGRAVTAYTLANCRGMSVRILSYGGIVQSLRVPDKLGRSADVVLGFPTVRAYQKNADPYFGALIGRYANRLAGGQFTLDGRSYQVPVNDPPNSLHGGLVGFDKMIWDVTPVRTSHTVGLRLRHVSPDGDQGFPGTLTATVTYTLGETNELRLSYRATTDKPTVVNLTNHSYFNLRGEGTGDVLDHRLWLNATSYTPVDKTAISTGRIAPVAGTPMSFYPKAHTIGERIRNYSFQQLKFGSGYDHNYVLRRPAGDTSLRPAAVVTEPRSGRVLRVFTTEPGIQFYSGNFLDGSFAGTSGRAYRQGDGFALETQHFPDSPNHPNFPTTTLRPGQVYKSTTLWRFGVAG